MRSYKPTEFISAMLHSNPIKVDSKRCSRCGKDKPIEQFYKTHSSVDSHRNTCDTCHKQHTAKRHKKAKEDKDFWKQFSPICDW